jgi:microcystin-dependent protein
MWSEKGRGRPARLSLIVLLVLISGLSAVGLASAARRGKSAGHQQAALSSTHFARCNWIGQVLLVGFDYAPPGTKPAQGQVLPISSNIPLYSLLGNSFGGQSGVSFGLPNLHGKAPRGLHYVICTSGTFPAGKSAADRSLRPGTARAGSAPTASASSQYGGSCTYQGQVVLVSFDFSFNGTVAAHGQLLSTSSYPTLFLRLGYTFGGSAASQMFGVPALRGDAPSGLHYRICTSGPYPSRETPSSRWCNWLGQVLLNSFNVPLKGTLPARGQTLPIQQNEALFALLGNTFGGNESMNTFRLPNLSGKAPPGLHYQVCNSGPFPART